jgi:adenylate cyclase
VSERFDRRLVAVMFTDMVGYTALMQVDERLGLDKRDRYMSALESQHDAFGGTLVQRSRGRQPEHVPERARCGAGCAS